MYALCMQAALCTPQQDAPCSMTLMRVGRRSLLRWWPALLLAKLLLRQLAGAVTPPFAVLELSQKRSTKAAADSKPEQHSVIYRACAMPALDWHKACLHQGAPLYLSAYCKGYAYLAQSATLCFFVSIVCFAPDQSHAHEALIFSKALQMHRDSILLQQPTKAATATSFLS